jgi:large subunit ribosomal protein L23
MRDPRTVIRRAIVTEKSTSLAESRPRYTFEVARDATKPEIGHAVESLFNVRVESVRTMNQRGKTRRGRLGQTPGRRPNWKKAVVTLAPGESLELFETT